MRKLVIILSSMFFLFGCQNNENRTKTIIEQDNNILIGINYPITKNKKLDHIIKSSIEKKYNLFKSEYENFNSLSQKAELNIDYNYHKSNEYHNIVIKTYLNSFKLKKPINNVETYVYNFKKNKLLSLKEIIPKEDLNYVMKEVKNEFNKNKCQTKLKANYKSFSNFTFDQNYLYLYFNSSLNNCNNTKVNIPLDNLNLKIDINEEVVNVSNTKVNIPTKILDPSKKFIAITFDDGPSSYTKNILKTLKKYDCNATFFVLGNKVEIYKDTIIESLKNGNEIGNHSYSHKWLIKLDDETLKQQIYDTQKIIKKTTGYTPTLLRPTYGSVNEKIKKLKDFKIVLWNVDTLDWKYKSVNKIVNRAVKNAKDGNIILMHDIHERTTKALDKIIPILKDEGFELITISEMEEIKLLRSKIKTD